MRLTLSTKYALLALEELARRGRPASARELAAAADIPSAYLAKLVPLLARAGILTTQRGRGGGVALARPAQTLSLKEIIEAVEGPEALQDCPFELAPCAGDPRCPLYPVWDPLRARLVEFLAQTSLAEVVRRTQPPKEEKDERRAERP
ncbi:MAG: Rrf2 family transcriptional regulator [Candidatus Bipolaricaulaceae bacterium]